MTAAFVQKWIRDESGAVTVDWVVLTAAIVTLGVAVIALISPSLTTAASDIAASIDSGLT